MNPIFKSLTISALVLISLLATPLVAQTFVYGRNIEVAVVGDFSISVSPSTLNVVQGLAGTATVIVSSSDNFSSPVTLSVAGLPSGAVAGFGTNPLTPPPGGSVSSPLIISVSSSVPASTYALILTGTNGTLSHSTTLTLKVLGSGDFTITVSPSSIIVAPGTFATASVTVVSSAGFSLPVSLTSLGKPFGSAVYFGPSQITPPSGGSATSLVTIYASSYSATGTYAISIIGTSGSLSHSTFLTVTVTQTGYPDFSLSATPTALSVVQGNSVSTTVTVTSINGFNSPVGLSVAWVGAAPSDVSFSYATLISSPASGTAAVTFTITTGSTASIGTFTFSVTGTSSYLKHTIDFTLQVSSATRDFALSVSPSALSILEGADGSAIVMVQSIGSFASSVTLAPSNAPNGMTVAFGANPVTPFAGGTVSSSIVIRTSAQLSPGTYSVLIVASSGSVIHSALITIIVIQPASADFSLTSSSNLLSINPGTSGSVTITIVSQNGFSSPVDLFASWLGGAPEDTTFSLPSPVTPPPNGIAKSTLRVTVGIAGSVGNFTLKVLGVDGDLAHAVDVVIKITNQQCVIATASYGSELSPEVQLLRNFRDNMILKAYAGASFLTVFNAWYYSFSPSIAHVIANHQSLRGTMKLVLYPLVAVLGASARAFTLAGGNLEIAAVLSGIFASWLLAAIYLSPLCAVVLAKKSHWGRVARRLERTFTCVAFLALAGIFVAELLHATQLMMFLTPALVLTVMLLSALFTSRMLTSLCRRLFRRIAI